MRFAMVGVDRYLGVHQAFVKAGWSLAKLFTIPKPCESGNQERLIAEAEASGADLQLTRITPEDLAHLGEIGCDALVVASYPWKIPDWRPYLRYGLNFHASPLPEGRGGYPLPQAILEGRAAWGVSCHQLTDAFDAGDLLAVDHFPMSADERLETLDLKVQMSAKRLAARVAADLPGLWRAAKPQGPGSYWRTPTYRDRLINFARPVAEIAALDRAYGAGELLALVNDVCVAAHRLACWREAHGGPPGVVAHLFNRTIVMTALDGYVALMDGDMASPEIDAALREELRRSA